MRDKIPPQSELARRIDDLQRQRDQHLLALSNLRQSDDATRASGEDLELVWRDLEPIERQLTTWREQATGCHDSALEELSLYQPVVQPLERFHAELPPRSAAIEFFPGPKNWRALAISPGGRLQRFELGSVADVREAQERWQSDIEMVIGLARDRAFDFVADQTDAALEDLGRLYDLLWQPLESALRRVDKVLVIPHGDLHRLPFAALYDAAGASYVIDRRSVVNIPSASVYTHCARRNRPSPSSETLVLGCSEPNLPNVKAEAQMIAQIFPKARTVMDSRFARTELQTHGAQAGLCHLAGHGFYEPHAPHLSRMMLGPEQYLTVGEAYTLPMARAFLTTLSGCETGLTFQTRGDELIGLQRGFLYAGSQRLLAGLWRISDQAAYAWMILFYQHLAGGLAPAAAMRQAMIGLRDESNGMFAHPVFWAGMQLVGLLDEK